MKKLTIGLAIVTWVLAMSVNLKPKAAQGADHPNLEEGLPVEVEDAYPIPYKGRELQGVFRYDRNNGEDIFILEPRVEYGFAPNWQGRIAVPFELGSGVEDDIGDVGLEIFYNFNAESLGTPAFALSAGVDFPTGEDSAGVDPNVRFIVTKTLGAAANLDRLHLNVSYNVNTSRKAGERDDRLAAVLGYSRRINSETIFLTDFIYEQEKKQEEEVFILEAGIRYQLSPRNVLAIGSGVGLNEDAPDFRISLGFQQSF